MPRILLAAVAALAFLTARPVLAGDEAGCKNCPHHKTAQAEKGDKKDAKAGCPCAGEGKECKCGPSCQCSHCAAKKAAEKKEAPQKT